MAAVSRALLSALLILALFPGAARADLQREAPPAPHAAQLDEVVVREGHRTAEALRLSGNLTGALTVLRLTYERVKTPFLLWPMAELHGQLHQPLAGLQALGEYEARLGPEEMTAPGRRPEDVARLRQELRAQVARLRVTADQPGALVLLDGRQQGSAPLPADIEVDPGRHVVEGRGAYRQSLKIDLWPGQRTLVPLQVSRAPGGAAAGRRVVLAGWILSGIGLGAVLGGASLWVLGNEGGCSGVSRCTPDFTEKMGGVGLFAGGVGVLGTAAVLLALDYQRRRAAPPAAGPL